MATDQSDEIEPFTEGEYKGMTRAEVALQHLMSDVSEECYCAGWMADCEFDIWRLATEGGTWGASGAEWLPQLAVILSHAREIDRWIVWNPDDNGGDDPWYIAVPLAEWEQRYAAEMAKREAAHQARLAKQAACDHADRRLDFMKRDYCPTCFLYFTEGDPAESSVDPEAEQSGSSEPPEAEALAAEREHAAALVRELRHIATNCDHSPSRGVGEHIHEPTTGGSLYCGPCRAWRVLNGSPEAVVFGSSERG